MRKSSDLISIFTLAIVMIGCKSNPVANITDTINISYDKIEKVIDLGDLLSDTMHFVELDATGDNIVGNIAATRINDNYIFVLDDTSDAVLKFNYDGELIDKIAKRGRAKGEYYNVTDFEIVGDNLYILDHISSKLIVYDLESFEFMHEYKFRNDSGVQAWGNQLARIGERLFLINNKSATSQGYYHLYEFSQGEFSPSIPFNKSESNWGWSLDRYCSTTEDNLMLYFAPSDTIYSINSDGALADLYFVNLGSRKISFSTIKREKKDALEYAINRNLIKSIENVNRLGNYLTFKFDDTKDTYCVLYSLIDKTFVVGQNFEINSLGRLSASDFYCDGGYFINIIPADAFRFLMSDKMIASRKSTFSNDEYERKVKSLRDRMTDFSNAIIIFSKVK